MRLKRNFPKNLYHLFLSISSYLCILIYNRWLFLELWNPSFQKKKISHRNRESISASAAYCVAAASNDSTTLVDDCGPLMSDLSRDDRHAEEIFINKSMSDSATFFILVIDQNHVNSKNSNVTI